MTLTDRDGKNDQAGWRARDRKALWRPFTQHLLWDEEDFPVIVRGEGVYLYDVDGNKYLDGVSSLWVNVHGHCRPEIDRAIRDQLGRIAHSTFLGLSHPPGIELAERLIALAPEGLTRVFFSDDGSTAMEIALKMAYQYWSQQDPPQPESRFFITLDQAYHGDTIGSVSLGNIDLFHQTYRPLLFPTISVPAPNCRICSDSPGEKDTHSVFPHEKPYSIQHGFRTDLGKGCEHGGGCLAEIDRVLSERTNEVAGVVIEPLVQGAAGIVVQPEGFVRGVWELCDHYGVLMIVDEVATGFGRTGTMFACEREGVTPDIMALGKGISGSYTANPLGCAAALASLDIFEKENVLENVKQRAEQAAGWLDKIMELSHVAECRQAGLMMGIEIEEDPHQMVPYSSELMMGRRVALAARERGLIVRPLSDVVVVMPPLCVTAEELDRIMEIAMESIREVTD